MLTHEEYELGLQQKDLVPIFKTESIVSAILNGKRKFTVEHRALHQQFSLWKINRYLEGAEAQALRA